MISTELNLWSRLSLWIGISQEVVQGHRRPEHSPATLCEASFFLTLFKAQIFLTKIGCFLTFLSLWKTQHGKTKQRTWTLLQFYVLYVRLVKVKIALSLVLIKTLKKIQVLSFPSSKVFFYFIFLPGVHTTIACSIIFCSVQ